MNQVNRCTESRGGDSAGNETLSVLAKKINTGKGERRNKSKAQENKKRDCSLWDSLFFINQNNEDYIIPPIPPPPGI